MALDAFTPSRRGTLGVELELQLVAPTDFDLVPASPDMLALLVRRPFPGTVTPEITQSRIEIATGIHESHATLAAELIQMRDALVAAGDRLNVGVCGGGTHPFQHWTERRIFEKPRFERVSALYGYLTRQFTVFGQHVHLGCADGDEALFLLHALNRYVPHFIALAASSPFVQGTDTLFDSSRLNAISAFPLSGRAPFLMSWNEFETRYFDRMAHTGIVASMKDFYWDIRPKPEYGTIELRVCDTPLTVELAAAIAAYLQSLCAHLLEPAATEPVEDDCLVYTYDGSGRLNPTKKNSDAVVTFTYDGNGNLTTGPSGVATFDAADRVTAVGGVAYAHDADGYLSSRGADTFSYGVRGELRAAVIGGQTITYASDALGRWV